MKTLHTLIVLLGLAASASAQIGVPTWQTLKNPPTFITDTALVLTDGTVMVHEYCTSNWHLLTPDNKGSYLNGTWSMLASMPSNYGPLYFASAVLPDGRVLVEGGEYNFCQGAETARGAIYDPVMNTWTNVNPPIGWTEIGDAPSVILSDGTFMLGQSGFFPSRATAFFNPRNLTWTMKGSGKADGFLEEGMELLPNGRVLVVDTQDVPNSEIFEPLGNTWTSAGSTIVDLVSRAEIGPALLRPDGTVFAMGANIRGGAGHTAIFNSETATWAAGPVPQRGWYSGRSCSRAAKWRCAGRNQSSRCSRACRKLLCVRWHPIRRLPARTTPEVAEATLRSPDVCWCFRPARFCLPWPMAQA